MKKTRLKVAARKSPLSLAQTEQTLLRLEGCFAELEFEVLPLDTAGDIDRVKNLEVDFPENFFTDTLDKAILSGEADFGVHSAKDMPEEIDGRFDWFWMPWGEDSRDAILFPQPEKPLPKKPRVGVSSASRRAYAEKKWPGAEVLPIRGNIDQRIKLLDSGEYDIILLAVAGLKRLGLKDRISEVIELEDLPTHPAQGKLAVTFKKNHAMMETFRQLLTQPLFICGAGTGRQGNYSVAVKEALEKSSICFHDVLMDREILKHCAGQMVDVGKRYGDKDQQKKQMAIGQKLIDAQRKGESVLRLKGGDPSLFARLSDEIEALQENKIPFKVLPGIPWICSAPLRHGIYLTDREKTRSFSVSTASTKGGYLGDQKELDRPDCPTYYMMGTHQLENLQKEWLSSGIGEDTPVAVFKEQEGPENIVRGCVADIVEKVILSKMQAPTTILLGHAASLDRSFDLNSGALSDYKILVPGSGRQKTKMESLLFGMGAHTHPVSTFQLKPADKKERTFLREIDSFDWLILASDHAAEIFIEMLKEEKIDSRRLPKIAVSGPAAAKVLAKVNLYADIMPDVYSSKALASVMKERLDLVGKKILILASSASDNNLASDLQKGGAQTKKFTAYTNLSTAPDHLPPFDAVVFSSPSAVKALSENHLDLLKSCHHIASIGPVTTQALKQAGTSPHVEAKTHDAQHLAWALASHLLWGSHLASS